MSNRNQTTMLRSGSDLFSVTELGRHLGVSRWTVYRLVQKGDLRAVRVGERLRFRPADVDAYLEREPALR